MAAQAGPAAAMSVGGVAVGVERHALADVPLVGVETGGGEHVLDNAGIREPDRYRRGVILRRPEVAERLKVRQVVAVTLMQDSVRAPFGGDPQQVRGGINAGHLGPAGVRSLSARPDPQATSSSRKPLATSRAWCTAS